MAELTEQLLKAIGKKFPVMNVIPSIGETGKGNTTVVREVKGHEVTLEIGISNVYIVDIKEIQDDESKE